MVINVAVVVKIKIILLYAIIVSRKREREREHSRSNQSSHWKKDSCSECGRNDVWVKERICFDCLIAEVRAAIQLAIQEAGLKVAQIQWESLKKQMKRDIEEGKKHDPQVETLGNKFIETIENDLYPNRKRNRLILWSAIIVAVIVLIGIIYWWWKKKDKGIEEEEELV